MFIVKAMCKKKIELFIWIKKKIHSIGLIKAINQLCIKFSFR